MLRELLGKVEAALSKVSETALDQTVKRALKRPDVSAAFAGILAAALAALTQARMALKKEKKRETHKAQKKRKKCVCSFSWMICFERGCRARAGERAGARVLVPRGRRSGGIHLVQWLCARVLGWLSPEQGSIDR